MELIQLALPGGSRSWNCSGSRMRLTTDQLERLINQIYEAALRPHLWGEVLLSIGHPINAHAGQLVVLTNDASATGDNLMVGLDASVRNEFEDLIERRMHVRATAVSRAPEMATLTDHQHMDVSEIKRNAFYQEHAIPCDVPYYAGTVICKQPDSFIVSVVLRSKKFGHLTKSEVAYLDRLAPHIRRSMELYRRIHRRGAVDGALSVLERLACAAVLATSDGSVVALNPQARDLILKGDGISDVNGTLSLSDRRANRRLKLEVREAFANSPNHASGDTGSIRAARPSGRRAYRVLVTPLRDSREPFTDHLCAVMIIDPDTSVQIPPGLLRESLDLTPAESDIASLLAAGQSMSSISEIRGTSIETVRTQLKSILLKSNCSSKSELISKLFAEIALLPKVG